MSAQLRPSYDFRAFLEADIPAVLAIERSSYGFPWTEGIFRDCLRHGYPMQVLIDETGHVQGYAILSVGAGEAHLLNLCISPVHRRLGLGRALLRVVVDRAARLGAATLFLEVRPSNQGACKLYEDEGFSIIGRRPAYYPAHTAREDALVMSRELQPPG